MKQAAENLQRLLNGNLKFLSSETNPGNISSAIRVQTAREGQHPFAIIISCSDSRVIPEAIFSCGIGELFTIRVAGNVLDKYQIGSVEYAAEHLDCPLVLILGHTHCGAVGTTIAKVSSGYIRAITDAIREAIGDETDDYKACCLNVQHNVQILREAFHDHPALNELAVHGAVYDIETGLVEMV